MNCTSKKITVFHVRNSNYAGGIETTLFGWFKYADPTRIHQRLFLFNERRQLHQRSLKIFEENGIHCELLPWGHIRNLPGAVYQLWKAVKASTAPILHSHDTRSDLVALIVARLTSTPLIISNHAWHPADFKRKVLEAIRAALMRGADLIISVSQDTHRETLEKGLTPEKCLAMYSGIDLEPYQNPPTKTEARRYLKVPDDCFLVGNMARLWPEKEHATLIEAAKILSPRHPNLRFIIIGDGPLADELKEQVRTDQLQEIVWLPGFKDNFVAGLAAMDCFAFPSSAEGTPMVIYSAMALGLPIVASPVSGVGEILQDQTSALLVPALDAQALSKAIESIYLNSEFAKSIGDNAKATAESEYSAVSAIRRLEDIYESYVFAKPGAC